MEYIVKMECTMNALKQIYTESFGKIKDNPQTNNEINAIVKLSVDILSARIAVLQKAGKLTAGKMIRFTEERFQGKITTDKTFTAIEKKYNFRFEHGSNPSFDGTPLQVIKQEEWQAIQKLIATAFNNNGWKNVDITMNVIDGKTFYIMFEGKYNG